LVAAFDAGFAAGLGAAFTNLAAALGAAFAGFAAAFTLFADADPFARPFTGAAFFFCVAILVISL
jgi:hypothetical protein